MWSTTSIYFFFFVGMRKDSAEAFNSNACIRTGQKVAILFYQVPKIVTIQIDNGHPLPRYSEQCNLYKSNNGVGINKRYIESIYLT